VHARAKTLHILSGVLHFEGAWLRVEAFRPIANVIDLHCGRAVFSGCAPHALVVLIVIFFKENIGIGRAVCLDFSAVGLAFFKEAKIIVWFGSHDTHRT
jgi:multidrug transporter EmrE-like cation transporter